MWATWWAANGKSGHSLIAGLFLGVFACGANSNGENNANTTGVMTSAAVPTSVTVGSGQTSGGEASPAASSEQVSSVGGTGTTSGGRPPANAGGSGGAGGAPSSVAAATTAGGGAGAPSSMAAATTAGTGGMVLTDCPEEQPELGVPCDTEQFGLCIYEWFRGDCTWPCAIYIRCNAAGETFQFEFNDGCLQCCLECGVSATTGG